MGHCLHNTITCCLVTAGLFAVIKLVNCDTRDRWQRQDEPQVLGCNRQLQTHISIQTNLTLAAIDHFKSNFSWHKFDVEWEDANTVLDVAQDINFLTVCNEENQCSHVLPVAPLPPYVVPANGSHAEQLMAEILEFSQQYAYAVEILFLDQSLHEDTFQYHMNEIYQHLESLVAYIIWGLRQCQVPVRETTLRELMGKVYKGADTTLRDERAFRTIRQCQLGLHYIGHFFSLNDTHPLLR